MSLPPADRDFITAAASAHRVGGDAFVMMDPLVIGAARRMMPVDLETVRDYVVMARHRTPLDDVSDGVASGVVARAILAAINDEARAEL